MTEAIEIKLSDIALRPLLSPRNGISQDVVNEYAEHIDELPPILVATDTMVTDREPYNKEYGVYVLIDGWHRYRAHQAAGHDTIMAIVDEDLVAKDFFFRAICANNAHGVRFTANEKLRISEYLFIQENRSAAEISQAIGCSVRHATDLIKDLAHEKKELAIQIAKSAHDEGYSEREIAAQLKRRGFKASKSGVNRWLQPEPVPTVTVKDKDAIQVSPQIGESPKRDIQETVEIGIATLMQPTPGTRIGVCPKCEIRTVRVPTYAAVASCTRLFFYCDKCNEFISILKLLEKSE